MLNKLGAVILALAIAAGGYAVGRYSVRAGALQADVAAASELAELRDEGAQLQRELFAARAQLTAAESPRPPDAPYAHSPLGGPAAGVLRKSLGPVERPELTPEQQRTSARQTYGLLLPELALPEPEVDALLDVLSKQPDTSPLGMFPHGERSPEQKAAIAAAIGPAKAAQFEQLEATLPMRSKVSLARIQLERAGDPMTEEQQRKLYEALGARQPMAPLPSSGADTPEETMERAAAWRRENGQRLRDSAKGVLTDTQIQRLKEGEALMEAMRAPLDRRRAAAGSPAPVPR